MSQDRPPITRREAAVLAAAAAASFATPAGARQDGGIMTPMLSFVFEVAATLEPAQELGEVYGGRRRVIPVTGGTVTGPRLNGRVRSGGADWQTILPTGVTLLRAQYTIEADDGQPIGVVNEGVRRASPEVAERMAGGELVPPTEYYFRTTPRFEVGPGPHAWLMESVFVCTGERRPNDVLIRFFEVS
jgi:hypothetical protein